MSYRVLFHPAALREFDKLPVAQQRRLASVIDRLAADPMHHGAQKLSDLDAYRVRAGDYRIVYAVQDDVCIVLIAKVGDRREIYSDMDAIRARLKRR